MQRNQKISIYWCALTRLTHSLNDFLAKITLEQCTDSPTAPFLSFKKKNDGCLFKKKKKKKKKKKNDGKNRTLRMYFIIKHFMNYICMQQFNMSRQ